MDIEQHIELKEDLNLIKEEIKKKQDRIVPIIGDECFVGYSNDAQTFVPLQQWLAEKLLGSKSKVKKKMKEKIFSEGYHGLDLLHKEYKRVFPGELPALYKNKISNIIKNGLEEKCLCLRKDVKNFLIAGQFEVVITTCPFNILKKEIDSGDRQYIISSFSPKISMAEATLKLPAIYQIFGKFENDYVSGESELLEYLHFLNQTDTEKGYGASQLVKYLKDKENDNNGLALLMPIGCSNLPNWIFRFLWYPLFRQRSNYRSDKQGGIWCKHSDNEDFYQFLIDYDFRTFSKPTDVLAEEQNGGDAVLIQLTEALNDKAKKMEEYMVSTLKMQFPNEGEYDLFISYSSDDEEFVKKIHKILTSCCDVKVWMDNRIKGGDAYWDSIQYGIEHSHKYLFVITESYLKKAVGKYVEDPITHLWGSTGVYEEIDRIRLNILNKRKDGEKNNIIPLIKSGTTVTYTDNSSKLHEDEPLNVGTLEKLPCFEEYRMMQTGDLFEGIHAVVCDYNNMEEELKKIFN